MTESVLTLKRVRAINAEIPINTTPNKNQSLA
jgi:hypothetical protein